MDSTNYNSVSYKTHKIPPGYVFKPNEDEIYSYVIPTRICCRKPVLGVEEIDIYGDKSPDDLFGKRDDPTKHIYLFTRLKKEKETNSRVKRSAGDGSWKWRKPTVVVREINGKEIKIGTKRQFTYKGGKQEWIMYEYCIEDDFLNFLINRPTSHPNPENIVLCHVYNKKAKWQFEIRGNNEEFNQQKKKRKTNYSNCENVNDHHHQPVLPGPRRQAYDRSNIDQAHSLVPQSEGDLMQEFMMENFDKMSLPEDAQVMKDFMSTDYGNGDHEYYPSTSETYNQVGRNAGF